ncbi:MAG TPA: hypothetical protein PL104_03870 [Caldisericia bacterium]|nr:hypothetical protein [Caldisericia bacterium]
MSIPNIFHVFQDIHADAGKITAERLNTNWSRLYDMFDPAKIGISEDNIKTISKILVANRNYTGVNKITGSFEFNACPIIPDASLSEAKINIVNLVKKVSGKIPDTDIDTNIPRKNINETISGSWTFSQSIKNLLAEHKETLPETVVNGQVVEYAGDLYVGKSGAWEKVIDETNLSASLDSVTEIGSVVSYTTRFAGNAPVVSNLSPPIKVAEIVANEDTGAIRVVFGGEAGAGLTLSLYLKKDGVDLDSLVIVGEDTVDKSYDFPTGITENSKLELWACISGGTGSCQVTRFNICYNLVIKKIVNHTLTTPLDIAWDSNYAYSFTNSVLS